MPEPFEFETTPELSDELAAQMLELLYEFARIFESVYSSQIRRYYDQLHSDFYNDQPPF